MRAQPGHREVWQPITLTDQRVDSLSSTQEVPGNARLKVQVTCPRQSGVVRDPCHCPLVLQMGNRLWAEEHLPKITQSWDENVYGSLSCQLMTLCGELGMDQHRQAVTKGSEVVGGV